MTKKRFYAAPALTVVELGSEESFLLSVSGGTGDNLENEGEEDLGVRYDAGSTRQVDVWEEW